jgi:hypothetical protein
MFRRLYEMIRKLHKICVFQNCSCRKETWCPEVHGHCSLFGTLYIKKTAIAPGHDRPARPNISGKHRAVELRSVPVAAATQRSCTVWQKQNIMWNNWN